MFIYHADVKACMSKLDSHVEELRKQAAEERARARKTHMEEEAARNREYREKLKEAGARGKEAGMFSKHGMMRFRG